MNTIDDYCHYSFDLICKVYQKFYLKYESSMYIEIESIHNTIQSQYSVDSRLFKNKHDDLRKVSKL